MRNNRADASCTCFAPIAPSPAERSGSAGKFLLVVSVANSLSPIALIEDMLIEDMLIEDTLIEDTLIEDTGRSRSQSCVRAFNCLRQLPLTTSRAFQHRYQRHDVVKRGFAMGDTGSNDGLALKIGH